MANITQKITSKESPITENQFLVSSLQKHNRSITDVDIISVEFSKNDADLLTFPIQYSSAKPILESKPKWVDVEYRVAYMEAAIHQNIAWQMKVNRQHRCMSKADLATLTGIAEHEISSFEDTEFEDHDIKSLKKIANAFDCALVVGFVSYSELAYKSNRLSKNHLIACGYSEETNTCNTHLGCDHAQKKYTLR